MILATRLKFRDKATNVVGGGVVRHHARTPATLRCWEQSARRSMKVEVPGPSNSKKPLVIGFAFASPEATP